MKQLIRAILIVHFAIIIFAICGCTSNGTTDATGGIGGPASPETTGTNQVNTSQLPDSSFIYDAQIVDLQNSGVLVDGQTVQVTGEVIGDRIATDYSSNFYWITLQATDGSYAEISVYMPASATEMIDTYGAYGKRGTILQVRGTFWAARTDHEGATELEAHNVSVVKRGEIINVDVKWGRFVVGGVLLLVGGGLALLYRHLGERRR